MSTIIKHPENLTGEAIGVLFVDGNASVPALDPDVRAALAEHGYKFEDVEDEIAIPDGEPTDKWSVKQVKAYAEREEIDISGVSKQEERLAAIAAHLAAKKAAEAAK